MTAWGKHLDAIERSMDFPVITGRNCLPGQSIYNSFQFDQLIDWVPCWMRINYVTPLIWSWFEKLEEFMKQYLCSGKSTVSLEDKQEPKFGGVDKCYFLVVIFGWFDLSIVKNKHLLFWYYTWINWIMHHHLQICWRIILGWFYEESEKKLNLKRKDILKLGRKLTKEKKENY